MGGYKRSLKCGLKFLVLYRILNSALSSGEVIRQQLKLKMQGNLERKREYLGLTKPTENTSQYSRRSNQLPIEVRTAAFLLTFSV
jgi:hypothetical protein